MITTEGCSSQRVLSSWQTQGTYLKISRGARIHLSYRSLNQNESNHHEPASFKPERFLPSPEGAGEKFPVNGVFGWGRRYVVRAWTRIT